MTMMRARGHVLLGLLLVVAGFLLLVVALERESERGKLAGRARQAALQTRTVSSASPSRSTGASQLPDPARSAVQPTADPEHQGAVEIAKALPALDAGSSDGSMDAATDAPIDAAGATLVFRFLPGGAAMSQTELPRLLAAAKAVALVPSAHVAIEAFGDLPGPDPLQVKIAAHRAKAAQYILQKTARELGVAGVSEKRITVSTPALDDLAKNAHSLRITTDVPLPELEEP